MGDFIREGQDTTCGANWESDLQSRMESTVCVGTNMILCQRCCSILEQWARTRCIQTEAGRREVENCTILCSRRSDTYARHAKQRYRISHRTSSPRKVLSLIFRDRCSTIPPRLACLLLQTLRHRSHQRLVLSSLPSALHMWLLARGTMVHVFRARKLREPLRTVEGQKAVRSSTLSGGGLIGLARH